MLALNDYYIFQLYALDINVDKFIYVGTACSFPKDLQKYFSLSSTIIRKAIQAGHNLKNFLPYAAEKQILRKSKRMFR